MMRAAGFFVRSPGEVNKKGYVQRTASSNRLQRRTNQLLLIGQVGKHAREESCSFAKEFGSARKELESAKEEFGLAKLLS